MMKIEVVEYQDDWIEKFYAEAGLLMNASGFLNPVIHHIGSTSLPGLAAKPVIDILLEIDDVRHLDEHREELEKSGYVGRGENGIPGRRYFEKGGDQRTYQIHGFTRGGFGALRHLAFRDYLIAHPPVAREYAALKRRVAESCHNDIERYCEGKDSFIKKHEKLAVELYLLNRQRQPDT